MRGQDGGSDPARGGADRRAPGSRGVSAIVIAIVASLALLITLAGFWASLDRGQITFAGSSTPVGTLGPQRIRAAGEPQPFLVRASLADQDQRLNLSAREAWALIAAGAASLLLSAALGAFLLYSLLQRRVDAERLAASHAVGELDARLLATSQSALAEQRKSASEREVLLREIHHRVKNNLQIIQSLLRLGSRDLRPEQREPFESAIRRIGVMARVHTLLYNSPDFASIEFKDYLEGLRDDLAQAFSAEARGISAEFKAEPMRVPLDMAVPLAFLAAELLTNAFQHAFPSGHHGGMITIEAMREDGFGALIVADNGVGLPGSAKGSLGLMMVTKLVEQIGGTLEGPGSGPARFKLSFPLAPVASSPTAPSLPMPAIAGLGGPQAHT